MKKKEAELFISNVGFTWGAATVERICNLDDGKVVIGVMTPKHKEDGGVKIYVTKSGKVRIFDERGEWQIPKEK